MSKAETEGGGAAGVDWRREARIKKIKKKRKQRKVRRMKGGHSVGEV